MFSFVCIAPPCVAFIKTSLRLSSKLVREKKKKKPEPEINIVDPQ